LPDHRAAETLDVTLPEKLRPKTVPKPTRIGEIEELLKENVKVRHFRSTERTGVPGGGYASVLRLSRQIEPKVVETYTRKECQPGGRSRESILAMWG